MKIALVGFGKVAEHSLSELVKKNLLPICVIVPIDRDNSLIKSICVKYKIKIISVRGGAEVESLLRSKTPLDVVVVASFPYLLSKKLLSVPKYGVINIHGSLLPKYRGYHPVHWAIINNERETGVTIHYIDEYVDSGDIIVQKKIPIKNTDDINSIIDKISKHGSVLLLNVLKRIENGKYIKRKKQFLKDVTFAPRRYPKDGKINWKMSSRDIFNLVRALKSPYINAFSLRKDSSLVNITETYISKKSGKVIGKIDEYFLISTGDGVVLVKTDRELHIGEYLI